MAFFNDVMIKLLLVLCVILSPEYRAMLPLLALTLTFDADATLKVPATLLNEVLLCEKMSKLLLVVAVMLLNAYSDMVLLLAASENVPVVAVTPTLE